MIMLSEENELNPSDEPKISSVNPVDRKAARELRIQRRQDAIKRDEVTIEFKETFEDEEALNSVEQQTIDSAALIQHLLADGEERVSNVRVASDAREVARRFAEFKKKREILAILEAEASLAEEKFDEISANWNPILEQNDPLDIQNEMNIQKERCKDLMMQKDSIIQELKMELKQADDTFYKDLQKQLNDVKQLGERIDAQVLLMKNAYQSQLSMIENSIELERVISIENNKNQWNILYQQRDSEEVSNIEKKFTQLDDFEKKMDALTIHNREKYRTAKIQLENEIQTLQKELQQLKATCLINSEKIDYNYQVLKRREEENVFVRSQQKRRLNKMQDIINELRNKIKSAQKERTVEENKASKDIYRLHEAILDLESKADHFTYVSERKYQQVWRMNKERADELFRTINTLDKTIHEEILGLNWTDTRIQLLKQSDLPSFKHAINNFPNTGYFPHSERKIDTHTIVNHESETLKTPQQTITENESKRRLIQHILKMIADSSGFLIEGRLWPLLEKYEKAPVILCKLDNIFNALEIKNEHDIKILCTFFMKYAYCEICKDIQDSHGESSYSVITENMQESHLDSESTSDSTSIAPDNKKSTAIHLELEITQSEGLLLKEAEEIIQSVAKEPKVESMFSLDKITKLKITPTSSIPLTCQNGHQLNVEPAHALNALRDFVGSLNEAEDESRKLALPKVPLPISRFLNPEDVATYWEKYHLVFPSQKEILWDGLLCALNKYLPILQDRQKLNDEVVGLRKQNSELRHLLRGHVPSADIPKQKYLTPISKSFRPHLSGE